MNAPGRFICYTALALLLFPHCIRAADGPAPASKADPDKRFDELLANAKADPSRTNWKTLRIAFTETSRYRLHDSSSRKELQKIQNLMERGDWKEAEKAIATLRDNEGWSRLDTLMTAERIYQELNDKKQAELQHRFIEGYLMTIVQPGRGQSASRPFEVIYIDEEYLILRLLGEKHMSQSLLREGGHFIDVLTTEAKKDAPSKKFYFNVDIPHKQLERMLAPAIEKARAKAAEEAAPAKK